MGTTGSQDHLLRESYQSNVEVYWSALGQVAVCAWNRLPVEQVRKIEYVFIIACEICLSEFDHLNHIFSP